MNAYNLKDIYNIKEKSLSWRPRADKSLVVKLLEGRKQSKKRITATIFANPDDSDKLLLWMISNSPNPRCFTNVDREILGFKY